MSALVCQISDAFKKFGISDSDSAVLVVLVEDQEKKVNLEDLFCQVEGQQVSLADLPKITDIPKVKKVCTSLLRREYKDQMKQIFPPLIFMPQNFDSQTRAFASISCALLPVLFSSSSSLSDRVIISSINAATLLIKHWGHIFESIQIVMFTLQVSHHSIFFCRCISLLRRKKKQARYWTASFVEWRQKMFREANVIAAYF